MPEGLSTPQTVNLQIGFVFFGFFTAHFCHVRVWNQEDLDFHLEI